MMPFIRVIALALALATSSTCSHPSESARNQYEAREDRLQPQLLTEATDHPPEVHMSQPDSINSTSSKQVDLHNSQGKRTPKLRQKRSYSRWSTRVVYAEPYQGLNVWRPSVYPISRPYYIPVYGVQGGMRIYFPPQQLYVNPGVPKENKPFMGSTYLPPPKPTTSSPPTTMNIGNRFNGGDNNDDRFIWSDDEVQRPTQSPLSTTVKPTRRTRPPGVVKTPPLVHSPTDPEGFVDAPIESDVGAQTPPPAQAQPQRPSGRPQRPIEPSRCVWAIISCCSSSDQISYECFEQRGCTGAFWDDSPCDSDFARAAIATALNYYNTK